MAELPNDPLRSGTVTLLLLFLRRPAVTLDTCVSIRRINLLARVSLAASLTDRSACTKTQSDLPVSSCFYICLWLLYLISYSYLSSVYAPSSSRSVLRSVHIFSSFFIALCSSLFALLSIHLRASYFYHRQLLSWRLTSFSFMPFIALRIAQLCKSVSRVRKKKKKLSILLLPTATSIRFRLT